MCQCSNNSCSSRHGGPSAIPSPGVPAISTPLVPVRPHAARDSFARRPLLRSFRRRWTAAAGVCLALTLVLTSFARGLTTASAASLDVATAEAAFLDLLNADRAAAGLPPLQADPRLMELARWRSEDLIARNYISHDIGGYTIGAVLQARQISYTLLGENLVLNTFDEARTVAMAEATLMSSATHRANILRSEFTLVGVGVAIGPNGRAAYTQLFIQG